MAQSLPTQMIPWFLGGSLSLYLTLKYHFNSEAKSGHVSVHILDPLETGSILDARNADPVYGMEFCFPKGNGSEKIRTDTKTKCF